MVEIRERPSEVTEHRIHARTCDCGCTTRAELPAEYRSAFGPRLVAFVASLTGVVKTSRRAAQEFVTDALGIPISLGSVSELEREVSKALDEPYAQAALAVREAPHKNVDETGWKQAGARRWLWTAATKRVAFFLIHPGRGREAFKALLGKVQGKITSDRWHVYAAVTNRRRQVCWAHLKRDFKRLSERRGEVREIGIAALEITSTVFMIWRDFRDGAIDRDTLQAALRAPRAELRAVLQRGQSLELPKVSTFCKNLLDLETALWTFTRHDGVEPTNNHAERVIRTAVIWRKRSFGCDSDRGCRFVERMLTVAQTCRLQGRSVHTFLAESVRALREGAAPPQLCVDQA